MKLDTVLKDSAAIAEYVYDVANAIEADDEDEKWRTAIKLKNAANDAYFYVAQVVGAGENEAQEFDCINARKQLLTLKAMYVFATKQGMAELDPAMVVKLEKVVDAMDEARKMGEQELERRTKVDLAPWLEKYRIWQKISKD